MDITIAGVAYTFYPNDDELAQMSLEFAAFDGQIGYGSFPLPDPGSALLPTTGRQFRVDEDTTLLTDGFILDWDRQRGPFRVGSQREYGITPMDANALLGGFIATITRPSETDYARVIAFATQYRPTFDTTWVLNTNTVTMPTKKYDSDRGFGELIADLAEFTGKTLFVHDKAAGGRCLHYHQFTEGHTSGLSINDDPAVQDEVTVFAPEFGQSFNRTSVDLRNVVRGRDQAGRISFAVDDTSVAAHNADGLYHQATIDFETTGQTDLNVKAAAYLASSKDDYDTRTVAIGPLDETALALIRVGDLISVDSAVLALTGDYKRIAHMTLTPYGVAPSPTTWLATLELEQPVRRRARVKSPAALAPTPNTVTPFVSVCTFDPTVFDDFDRTVSAGAGTASGGSVWSNVTTPGGSDYGVNGSQLFLGMSGGTFRVRTPTGAWTSDDVLQFQTRISFFQPAAVFANYPGFTMYLQDGTNFLGWQWSFNGTTFDIVSGPANFATYTYPSVWTTYDYSGDPIWFGVKWEVNVATGDISGKIWLESDGEPAAYQVTMPDAYIVPLSGTVELYVQVAAAFSGRAGYVDILYLNSCAPSTPVYGQEVTETIGTGDGATTVFTTTHAYLSGIKAYVNDLPEWEISETTSTTITFSSPPFSGEIIRVTYKAAA